MNFAPKSSHFTAQIGRFQTEDKARRHLVGFVFFS